MCGSLLWKNRFGSKFGKWLWKVFVFESLLRFSDACVLKIVVHYASTYDGWPDQGKHFKKHHNTVNGNLSFDECIFKLKNIWKRHLGKKLFLTLIFLYSRFDDLRWCYICTNIWVSSQSSDLFKKSNLLKIKSLFFSNNFLF